MMRRAVGVLTLTAGLALTCSPANATGEDCTTTTEIVRVLVSPEVPAVPAVPGTPAVPAVPAVYETVTEYEFTHAQDGNGNGKGPENKWVTDPEWNAEGNPNSVGWVATGNTRQAVTDVVLVPAVPEVPAVPGVPEVPAVPAVYEDREVPVTVCVNPGPVNPAPTCEDSGLVTAEDGSCVPGTFYEEPVVPGPVAEVPVAVVPVVEPSIPVVETAVRPAVEAAPLTPTAQELPAQLAYTGASDWALPAGALALLAGTALVMVGNRRGVRA